MIGTIFGMKVFTLISFRIVSSQNGLHHLWMVTSAKKRAKSANIRSKSTWSQEECTINQAHKRLIEVSTMKDSLRISAKRSKSWSSMTQNYILMCRSVAQSPFIGNKKAWKKRLILRGHQGWQKLPSAPTCRTLSTRMATLWSSTYWDTCAKAKKW